MNNLSKKLYELIDRHSIFKWYEKDVFSIIDSYHDEMSYLVIVPKYLDTDIIITLKQIMHVGLIFIDDDNKSLMLEISEKI